MLDQTEHLLEGKPTEVTVTEARGSNWNDLNHFASDLGVTANWSSVLTAVQDLQDELF